MRKGQRRPQRRSQSVGWGNCWVLALSLWTRDPRWSYLIIRLTRQATFGVPHVMWAKCIAGVEVTETKPLQSLRGWPWWKVILFSTLFLFRVRVGVGEEHVWRRTPKMFTNPRVKQRYQKHEHYVRYLIKRKQRRR